MAIRWAPCHPPWGLGVGGALVGEWRVCKLGEGGRAGGPPGQGSGLEGPGHHGGDSRPRGTGLRHLGRVFQAYVAFLATCLGTATSQT